MFQSPKSREPIPGYTVKERIGVGGYGEVWSANAPGGLTKAIKFVYGYFDDARASRELKALDRIKQVRHPFLLSLERFEVADGQLVIVTELAEMSLKDRYEQTRESGAPGIPRDELLGYLRDAADALDYMSENFSLQHLDVKPENLLLVGGRVKVADFGLVKNLHEATAASLMGGLTPIYAAPEVFDDRPSGRSDQYSLAIVYQEMLTGNLPFPGRTPAQLASQHLHASPRLATLPAADQLVIAQALAKNPVERFASCRAFVDALCEAKVPTRARPAPLPREKPAPPVSPSSETTSVRSQAAKTDTDSPQSKNAATQVLGGAREDGADEPTFAVTGLAPQARPIEDLPPLELGPAAGALRPTLFLGIGGTAGKTLASLRRRLEDRFGSEQIPSLRMLLLDTDVKSLLGAAAGDAGLHDGETMPLALRSARDYTANSRKMMQWLSRRWLYNIPRSLQTEGRRPLGRLALVDHAGAWLERLSRLLAEMTSEEALAASTDQTGEIFEAGPPRVFIVASLSGGTGGGMVLDVAYAVRHVLAELGCGTDGVCEILTHSTDRNPAAAELATANAYASLIEMEHYARFGYRPGEPSCGLPPPTADRRGLDNAYFVHLGDGLNDEEFTAATDVLASYLYFNTATRAAVMFEKCRAGAPADGDGTSLRSFGLSTVGCSHTSLPPLAAEMLCRGVIDHWRGKGPRKARSPLVDIAMGSNSAPIPATPSRIADEAVEHAAALELAIEPLREQVAALVAQELGGDADTIFAQLRTMVEQHHPESASRTRQLIGAIEGLFDPAAVSEETPKPVALQLHSALEAAVKPIAAAKGEVIAEWILERVNDPATRIAGAMQAKQWYVDYLRDLEAQCAQQVKDTQHNLQALEQTLIESEKSAPSPSRVLFARRAMRKHLDQVDGVLRLIVALRVTECALQGVCRLLRRIAADVSAAGDKLKDMHHELGLLAHEFEAPAPWDDDEAEPAGSILEQVRAAAARGLREQMGDMIRRVDARFEHQFLLQHDGLRTVCGKGDALRKDVVDGLRTMARAEVLAVLKQQAAAEQGVWGSATNVDERQACLESCLEAARTRFNDCGGAQRLLAVVPEGSTALEEAVSRLTPPATKLAGADAEFVVCYEQQGLSLGHVAARLIDGRGDIIQIAGRLHTRMDIPWSKLPQVAARSEAGCNSP